MIVKGRVVSRSSKGRGGLPSESELLELNPQREEKILKATGWKRVEPGTLNLRVDDNDVNRLLEVKETFFEPPDEVYYPTHQYIPEERGGYNYYFATAKSEGKTQGVLVRRGKDNPLPGRLELFAEINLREHFRLKDDDEISLRI